MTGTWTDLSRDLTALHDADRTLLQQWPSAGADAPERPWPISLAAFGESAAERLHVDYGDDVVLTVGALRYPAGDRDPSWPVWDPAAGSQPLDEQELAVELDQLASVASGHTGLAALRVINLSGAPITINTNGHVNANLADPKTEALVGGFVGAEAMPLVRFRAEPGGSVVIPLVVGTASFTPSLGYRVRPGDWSLFAILPLDDGRKLRTPLLPVTITP